MNEISEQLKTAGGREWLAMQFVLGELSEDQRLLFESAMADDMAVCEAVVDASRLSAGLVLALESRSELSRPVVIRRRTAITRFGVFATAVALVFVVIVVANSQFSGVDQPVAVDDAAAADAFVDLLPVDLPAIVDVESDEETVFDDSLADLVAPEWLLTAVDLDEAEVDGDKSADEDTGIF